jgi:hypothetical protein
MKKFLGLFAANYILVILQTAYLVEFFGFDANPNLVLGLTLGLILARDFDGAYISALIGGILYDVSSAGILGVSALYGTVSVFIIQQICRFYVRGRAPVFLSMFVLLLGFVQVVHRHFVFNFYIVVGAILSILFSLAVNKIISGLYEKHSI